MERIRTHYDNLKVARNAPPEVIRAAYKALCQKYHPDKNPGDPEAARIMKVINASYEVLSDPAKRREHDLWIQEQERIRDQQNKTKVRGGANPQKSRYSKDDAIIVPPNNFKEFIRRTPIFLTFTVLFVLAVFIPYAYIEFGSLKSHKLHENTATSNPEPYMRPAHAPNGMPWPSSAGYVDGYPILRMKGRSSIKIDNSKNASDVFVKLVSTDDRLPFAIRHVFIPAHSGFVLNKLPPGKYEVRYQDLNDGAVYKTETIEIEEKRTPSGTLYSETTITLYKVPHGNMHVYKIPENEF